MESRMTAGMGRLGGGGIETKEKGPWTWTIV